MNRTLIIAALAVMAATAALVAPTLAQKSGPGEPDRSGVTTRSVDYKIGEAEFQGFMATPGAAMERKTPAVVIVHDWMGQRDFDSTKATELAKLGYVAFACDMYGKGVRPKDAGEARAETTKLYTAPDTLRERINAAIKLLKDEKAVDPAKVCVMGFCFGGAVSLEAARSGTDIAGVISFHGGLATQKPATADTLKAKVLVLHGADDPYVPQKDIDALYKEMRDAKADWQFVAFGNSVHSFTNPAAGNDNSKGAAYNAKADARSWEMMKDFLAEVTK